MKKFLVIAAVVGLLAGCTTATPAATSVGTVANCDSISIVESNDPTLECLDGGEGVAVSAIRGPALLNIWGTWCPPCRQELPYLAEYFENYGDQVNLIGIAVEEKSSDEVVAFVKERGMKWPILFDRDNSTRDLFGMGVPVTWFIDASGRVAYKHYGAFVSTEAIEIAVAEHLGVK